VQACPEQERGVLDHQLGSGLGCVPTSSMGRLFDAVSSLCGVRHVVDYEAEAAIELEGLARAALHLGKHGYRFAIGAADGTSVANAAPVVRAVSADLRAGVPLPDVAARFHDAVAELVVDLALLARTASGLDVVALGGGVFANSWLLEAAQHRLTEQGFTVLRPRLLPPNDGGIALGQLLVGASG
jgi:hydrogenase maturation protein HypF